VDELTRVTSILDVPLPAGALGFIRNGAVELPPAHTLDGNPMRYSTGPVPLSADEGWRTALPAADRRLVERITAPLRRRYGYR
jgi:hypothetical protein